jgi:D-alanyl-lipoteichoic acid acyltransferase DltB (MBOAT superfamily)
MLFNSFAFLAFFAIVAILYYIAPQRWRWILLLVASYYFYSAFQLNYLLLLLYATAVAYGVGIAVARRLAAGRIWLVFGVVAELFVLVVFKYTNFISGSLSTLINATGLSPQVIVLPRLDFILPAGLSFYTFSAISYIIDVYRRKIEPETHPGRLGLYIAFFPKLLAGPIERAGTFLKQIREPVAFTPSLVVAGMQLILLGLFKKVVIADRLAEFVNGPFGTPAFQSPVTLLVAVYFYAFQIYCDFSGYSDIAIGASAVLGIRLMENFRRPYFARSVAEFWGQRWHISLMQWFRDYLYIPLGGNRVSKPRWYGNQMIVFVVSGLWHGANWTFVIWGALNGAYQVLYLMTSGVRGALGRILPHGLWVALSVMLTFHLILLSWIFFRADTVDRAWTVISRIVSAIPQYPALLGSYQWTNEFFLALILIAVLLLFEAWDEVHGFWRWLQRQHTPIRWGVYYATTASLLVIGKWGVSQFVYMQF